MSRRLAGGLESSWHTNLSIDIVNGKEKVDPLMNCIAVEFNIYFSDKETEQCKCWCLRVKHRIPELKQNPSSLSTPVTKVNLFSSNFTSAALLLRHATYRDLVCFP